MTIRVGTIVTPFDPGDPDELPNGHNSCKGYWVPKTDVQDVCVGIVIKCDDIEQIVVKWLSSCREHNSPLEAQSMPINELWEIGQIS